MTAVKVGISCDLKSGDYMQQRNSETKKSYLKYLYDELLKV